MQGKSSLAGHHQTLTHLPTLTAHLNIIIDIVVIDMMIMVMIFINMFILDSYP